MANSKEMTLEHARKKERSWTTAEVIVGLAAVAALAFFEDAELHEAIFVVAEGLINWRRSHWSNQVKVLEAGGAAIETDLSSIPRHIVGARQRHESRKALARS